MAKEVKDPTLAPEDSGTVIESPAQPEAVVAVSVMSDLSMLRQEALHKGRTGSGDGIMGQFKERLVNVLEAAVADAKGGEVASLPCGAVVRFFLKKTTTFDSLAKDDRYNRAYRYLAQAKKTIARIGWDITKVGTENFLVYTGKIS